MLCFLCTFQYKKKLDSSVGTWWQMSRPTVIIIHSIRMVVLERAEKKAGGRARAMPHHSKSGKGICGQCPLFKHRAWALAGRASGIYGQFIIIKYGHFRAKLLNKWQKIKFQVCILPGPTFVYFFWHFMMVTNISVSRFRFSDFGCPISVFWF